MLLSYIIIPSRKERKGPFDIAVFVFAKSTADNFHMPYWQHVKCGLALRSILAKRMGVLTKTLCCPIEMLAFLRTLLANLIYKEPGRRKMPSKLAKNPDCHRGLLKIGILEPNHCFSGIYTKDWKDKTYSHLLILLKHNNHTATFTGVVFQREIILKDQ